MCTATILLILCLEMIEALRTGSYDLRLITEWVAGGQVVKPLYF